MARSRHVLCASACQHLVFASGRMPVPAFACRAVLQDEEHHRTIWRRQELRKAQIWYVMYLCRWSHGDAKLDRNALVQTPNTLALSGGSSGEQAPDPWSMHCLPLSRVCCPDFVEYPVVLHFVRGAESGGWFEL